MRFIDEAEIEVKGGDGGNGCKAFRREPSRPKGGPSGGDGGRGGDVAIEATSSLTTLLEMMSHQRWKAGRGRHGSGNDRYGRSGEDVLVHVPVGTVVEDADTGERIADLDAEGKRATVAKGGKGGRGNIHFKTSTRQAPDFAEEGGKGEVRRIRLELKLLADVGIVGFPNVGKSSLVRRVSAATPRVADYPFTTLAPTPGVVRLDDERDMVIADMPGLIEGASDGAGLGIRFLRHVERTRVLLHLIAPGREQGKDPLDDWRAINLELSRFSEDLAGRPQVVAINKVDLTDVREAAPRLARRLARAGAGKVLMVSAATGEGLPALMEALWRAVEAGKGG